MQRGDIVGRAAGGPQRPHEDRHVLERVAQRPDDVGITDPAFGAGRLDRRAAGLVARDRPHRVAVGDQQASQLATAAATADEQDTHLVGLLVDARECR